jgi:hypothetical protein
MTQSTNIKLFEDNKTRSLWDDVAEKWYFSVVDIIAVLTDSPDAENYWHVLKHRINQEVGQSITICNELKLQAVDGKFYKTAVGAKLLRK